MFQSFHLIISRITTVVTALSPEFKFPDFSSNSSYLDHRVLYSLMRTKFSVSTFSFLFFSLSFVLFFEASDWPPETCSQASLWPAHKTLVLLILSHIKSGVDAASKTTMHRWRRRQRIKIFLLHRHPSGRRSSPGASKVVKGLDVPRHQQPLSRRRVTVIILQGWGGGGVVVGGGGGGRVTSTCRMTTACSDLRNGYLAGHGWLSGLLFSRSLQWLVHAASIPSPSPST